MKSSPDEKTYALFSTPQNRKLAAALEESEAKVFQFEPVEIHRINAKENAGIIKNKLAEFDWIVFPDVYTVDLFLELLEENRIDLFELDAAQVLALGEAVADKLRFVQLHADVIPQTIEAEIVFQTLADYLGKEDLSGLRILLPRGENFDLDFLKNKLIESGAKISEIVVYRAEIAEKNKTTNLKALLKGGAIDEFIISSAEDVVSLKNYLLPENLTEIFSGIQISGTSEVSFQALRENKLRPRFFHVN